VTLVPTRHWSARGLFDRNRALWASFVLETPAGKSTSSAIPAMARAAFPSRRRCMARCAGDPADRRLRAALVHAGSAHESGRCGHGASTIAARKQHWRITTHIQLTDEAIDAPLTALGAALDEANIPRERFVALKPGRCSNSNLAPLAGEVGLRSNPGEGSRGIRYPSAFAETALTPILSRRAGRGEVLRPLA